MYIDTAKWLWEQFGKDITRFAKAKWGKFNWAEAEQKYREELTKIHSTTRLLGHSKPINVDEIFTDVYVLDKLTAHQRFGLKDLPEDEQELDTYSNRKPALRLAINQNKLFILGKPGAGKTTFLKYIVLKACEGKIRKTPIYVSLKEWSDSDESLEQGLNNYLIKQFDICSFPNAETFIDQLLKNGKALILFDGLDEVKQEGNIRSKIISLVNNFANKHSNNQIFITCRIAAVEYTFDNFTYVEIADFTIKQTAVFARKWFQGQQLKSERFLNELKKTENKGFLELTKTPLLLTLLCLAYDELLEFPARRVDLYKEAFDALLKKWDASRGVQRGEIYRGLSTLWKENLLSRIAYQNFEKGKIFFREEDITKQISDYLAQLPIVDVNQTMPDGNAVLKAIEAQHGLIVERAYGIYSFSHLTFQEYLTARYIAQNAGTGTLHELAKNIFLDQWNEVVAITASLLDNADIFFNEMYSVLNSFINSKELFNLFEWLIVKSNHVSPPNAGRTLLLLWQLFKEYLVNEKKAQQLALRHMDSQELTEVVSVRRRAQEAFAKTLWITQQIAGFPELKEIENIYNHLFFGTDFDDEYHETALKLIHEKIKNVIISVLDIGILDLEKQFKLSKKDYQNLLAFLDGTIVIFKSLELATVSDRRKLKEMILFPKS